MVHGIIATFNICDSIIIIYMYENRSSVSHYASPTCIALSKRTNMKVQIQIPATMPTVPCWK